MDTQCYYRVSIKGIAVDATGRILLSKETNGLWELLGGGIEHGEDPITCLKREIAEETGLVVTYVSPTPKYFITAKRKDYNSYIANVVYEIKLKDLVFTPSEECIELRFFTKSEAMKLDLFPNVSALLKVFEARNHSSISTI